MAAAAGSPSNGRSPVQARPSSTVLSPMSNRVPSSSGSAVAITVRSGPATTTDSDPELLRAISAATRRYADLAVRHRPTGGAGVGQRLRDHPRPSALEVLRPLRGLGDGDRADADQHDADDDHLQRQQLASERESPGHEISRVGWAGVG